MRDRRAQVRADRLLANPVCEAPERGLPGECCSPDPTRPVLEVNEIVPRSRARYADLVLDLTSTLCQHHHDAVTSSHGEAKDLAEKVGLLLPSEAVGYAFDDEIGKRLPFLLDEWKWARP